MNVHDKAFALHQQHTHTVPTCKKKQQALEHKTVCGTNKTAICCVRHNVKQVCAKNQQVAELSEESGEKSCSELQKQESCRKEPISSSSKNKLDAQVLEGVSTKEAVDS